MSLLVAVTWETQPWVERFRRHLPDRAIAVLGEDFDRSAIRYVTTWGPKPGSLSHLPNLEAIFSLGAGVDHLMSYPDLPDVPIVRVAQDDLTHRMSEYMVLHCLMHLREQRRFDEDQKAKRWNPDRAPPIAGEVRVGIMGFGVLGQDSARKLKMMGFDVAGWSRTSKVVEGFDVYAGEGGLTPFLNRTDILIALMPLTPDTKGILKRSLFEKLPRDGKLGGPILINAGRGKLQVEADILSCLDDGTLMAATLDVFETEPLPESSPLWTHSRVTITPHNSATSEPEATARYIAQQIRRHEAGEVFENVVDRARGY
ncbi:glyoxylate/hydroxypyruvate reductase A [Microvirga sp. HBU67558]|uniref:2-hydroxyacid dehydrogenase n=1 Tax=Microvirga TaxID=186650 RepID=UPI001B39CC89|nr:MULTISPECIES: glyoxylate/hydroxypyruvate reductase A [unclassified Microvirga]MBQ0823266.1 glyoxylate/hydroxypyruvate reductase A [Microvirga sp. HBU67558]